MRTHIGLIRGINVGGKNLLRMAGLREMLAELGLDDSETLLQSGNFVFSAPGKGRGELEEWLSDETEKRFAFRPVYCVRTIDEWDRLIADNPFHEETVADPSHLLVSVFKTAPDVAEAERLQIAIQGPEKIRVVGENLYATYPDGIGSSTIGKTPGWNKFVAGSTARNWNTILKLAALVRK